MAEFPKLKACFDRATAGTAGILSNLTQWNDFTAELIRNNHISREEAETLETVKPAFPVSFERVVMTLAQCKVDPQLSRLLELTYQLDEDVVNTRALLDTWNLQAMNHKELGHVLAQLARVEDRVHTSQSLVTKTASKLQMYSEDTQRGLYDKVFDLYTAFRNAHNYQEEEYENIEKQWYSQRVRHVQYRNRAVKVIKTLSSGVIRQVGFCADKDFPLEVLKVPHYLSDYEYLQSLSYQISASKQLLFSKYYACYYGFDDMSDPDYNLYFFELLRGDSIRQLLSGRILDPTRLLFRYWIQELRNAFTDLLLRCTHQLNTEISLANIFVQDYGMKVYIRRLEFGDYRAESTHYETEARLLTMYGTAVLELLTGGNVNTLPMLFTEERFRGINPELRSIVEECVYAYERYKDKLQGEVVQEVTYEDVPRKRRAQKPKDQHALLKDSLTFLRLQTHPYFRTSEVPVSSDLEGLVTEFEELQR